MIIIIQEFVSVAWHQLQSSNRRKTRSRGANETPVLSYQDRVTIYNISKDTMPINVGCQF